jgi:metal-responsive CopG/Arc/MetJ family transcriptional regulator
MPTINQTRKFTISFPEDLARKVDRLAKEESRNTSELFREAFRTYFAQQVGARMRRTQELAQTTNVYTKSDTKRLLDEARREMKTASTKP